MNFSVLEADNLAKKVLDERLLSLFIEARVLGREKQKKLIFFFKKITAIRLFERKKNEILQRLRLEYKKNMSFYKKNDFIFYGIEAKNGFEMKHRDKKSLKTLEKGIARLENLVKTMKERN